MLAANTFGLLLLAPVAVLYFDLYDLFTPFVWSLVLLTGMFQAFYFASLANAYKSGDISLAYPLARSAPVLVVAFVTFILGQGEAISWQCVGGILLVVSGCFLVPMNSFGDFNIKNYWCRTCGFAFLAAIATTGYSITDAEALATLGARLGEEDSLIVVTLLYACVEGVGTSLWLLLFVLTRKGEREQLRNVLSAQRLKVLLAGMAMYMTYSLVLMSMSMVTNVSYVVGFRQLSIPLGVMLGVYILKEPMGKPKAVGVAILVSGLILIATG